MQVTDVPPPQSATRCPHPIAHKPLFTSAVCHSACRNLQPTEFCLCNCLMLPVTCSLAVLLVFPLSSAAPDPAASDAGEKPTDMRLSFSF